MILTQTNAQAVQVAARIAGTVPGSIVKGDAS